MSGVHLLKDMLNFKKVIIAVEDNKPDAIKILERIAEKGRPRRRNQGYASSLKIPAGCRENDDTLRNGQTRSPPESFPRTWAVLL